jgi:hypothetical protein
MGVVLVQNFCVHLWLLVLRDLLNALMGIVGRNVWILLLCKFLLVLIIMMFFVLLIILVEVIEVYVLLGLFALLIDLLNAGI